MWQLLGMPQCPWPDCSSSWVRVFRGVSALACVVASTVPHSAIWLQRNERCLANLEWPSPYANDVWNVADKQDLFQIEEGVKAREIYQKRPII
jgi:hypothetical protein